MNIRFIVAVSSGKLCQKILRASGRNAAALPGLITEKLFAPTLDHLSRQCKEGVVLICGTNGKTTTSRMLAAILEENSSLRLVHNRSGSNLLRGHLSAFLEKTGWFGKVKADLAILEVDEAALPEVVKQTKPRLVLLHNLFRDQLDRYGEVDSISKKWRSALSQHLPKGSTLVVNADDPNLAFLSQQIKQAVPFFYGLDDRSVGHPEPTSSVDVYLSPASSQPLRYSTYYVSHLGEYYDPASSFRRPNTRVSAKKIDLSGEINHSSFNLAGELLKKSLPISLKLPGLYNIYNALGAASAALALGVPAEKIGEPLASLGSAFGRFETVQVKGRDLTFCLIKNPAGATEVINTISQKARHFQLAVFANDNFADGQDVSWYWDTRFEGIAPQITNLICSGNRAGDMALRLKYADCRIKPQIIPAPREALNLVIANLKAEEPTFILSTYTATLELQELLKQRKIKSAYWKE